MTVLSSAKTINSRSLKQRKRRNLNSILVLFLLICLAYILPKNIRLNPENSLVAHLPELAMDEGDTYIRALMLTISASESNHKNSYALLYGGSHVHDLTKHPNKCIPIKIGPNQGKCSTAAGRYQFLTSTWREKARQYHPAPQKTEHGIIYSFEPQYQDIVVYRWLKDHHQWDVDILTLLKEDRVEEVLSELSDTWTSLGGGIEDNSMTPHLPKLYRYFLDKELKYSAS